MSHSESNNPQVDNAPGENPHEAWHRVHRLTPLLQFWKLLIGLIVVAVVNLNATIVDIITEELSDQTWAIVGAIVAGVILACLLVWGFSQIWWKAMGYQVSREEVALRKGVISSQLRTARFDRVQAIDVTEPLIARIFGLASIRIETAGGSDSAIEIQYLPKAEAERLREYLLQRVHGADDAESAIDDSSVAAEAVSGKNAPPQSHRVAGNGPGNGGQEVLPEIPIRRVLGAELLSISNPVVLVIIAVGLFTPLNVIATVPLIVGLILKVWSHIDSAWKFTAVLNHSGGPNSSESLDIRYGLTSVRRQSIPLHRIHAVCIQQPLLWRLVGWYKVTINAAGYGDVVSGNSGSTTIVPVAGRDEAIIVAALASSLDSDDFQTYAAPEGYSQTDFTSPQRAVWVSPVDHGKQAVTLVDNAVITHHGRFTRVVEIVAERHIQELSLIKGPIQQLFNLRTLRLDLVDGPVVMKGRDLAPDDAETLVQHLRQRELPELVPLQR